MIYGFAVTTMRKDSAERKRLNRQWEESCKREKELTASQQHERWQNENIAASRAREERQKYIDAAERAVQAAGGDLLARTAAGAKAAVMYDNMFQPKERKERIGMTQGFYNRVIEQGEKSLWQIGDIRKNLDAKILELQKQHDEGIVTNMWFHQSVEELKAEADKDMDEILASIDKVKDEYAAKVNEWGEVSGSKLNMDDMNLLKSGIKLTADEVQHLADKYSDNNTMTRLVKEYWNGRSAEIIASNKQKEGLLGVPDPKNPPEKDYVKFTFQSPQEKIDIFSRFADNVKVSAKSGIKGNHATEADFWKASAKESIGKMKPVGNETIDVSQFAPSAPPAQKAQTIF